MLLDIGLDIELCYVTVNKKCTVETKIITQVKKLLCISAKSQRKNMYSKHQDLFINLVTAINLVLHSDNTKTILYGEWATLHTQTTKKTQQTLYFHHSMCFRIPASVFSKAGLLADSIQM